jgi:hypothetical protein
MVNVVGIVNNRSEAPLKITMGLDIVDNSGKTITLQEAPYGRVIYPGKGAPFEFRVAEGVQVVGKPYVVKAEHTMQPFYDTLVFNYTNMAVGEERALVGTVKNTGPFEFRNLSVFASVHDENTVNIDSVRSNVIPVLMPGEQAMFVATPDPAIKAQVYYYSCAGFDIDAAIPTLPSGDGGFIPYNFQAVAKVSSLRYDNTTDSISFGIVHYNPKGGPAALKVPQLYQNQTVTVMMDGEVYDGASITMDGRTVSVDMFIPPGDHNVQVQGVRTVPEFPLAALGLAAVMAAVIAAARLRAAFKIS